MKKVLVGVLIVFGIGLTWIGIDYYSGYEVLKVHDGDTIYVDLNRNGKADKDEKLRLNGIDTFETKYSYFLTKQAQTYDITQKQALGLGYLGTEFAKKKLLGKRVKVEINGKGDFGRKLAHIYIFGQNFEKQILKAGLASVYRESKDAEKYLKYENVNKIKKNAEKANKLDLVLLNLKNNKYHKPFCKYAKNIAQYDLIQLKDLPKEAKQAGCCKHKKESSFKFDDNKFYELLSQNKSVIYFVDPIETSYSSEKCVNSVCGSLVSLINNAKNSLDIAAYGYQGQSEIINALRNAKKRGVKIRGIVDDTTYKFYKDTKAIQGEFSFKQDDLTPIGVDKNYKEKFTREKTALMHNKFVVVDGKYLWTGSTNITDNGMTLNANNSIVFLSPKLANIYTKEFNQMYEEEKFHVSKSKTVGAENVQVSDNVISVYFSPQDRALKNALIPMIDKADKSIKMMIFYLTNKKVVKALQEAKLRGIDVKIIMDFEPTAESYSPIDKLRDAGILVKVDNWQGKMHMKTVVFDDKYSILGSTNWTGVAEYANDENMILLENKRIANQITKEFNKLWASIPNEYLTIKASKKHYKAK